jgi:hypothetical protein
LSKEAVNTKEREALCVKREVQNQRPKRNNTLRFMLYGFNIEHRTLNVELMIYDRYMAFN